MQKFIEIQKKLITIQKEIEELAKTKYKNLAGIAQQYLFYWKRETA